MAGHKDLLAALLLPVSYDPNAEGVDRSLTVEGAALDRVQAASAAVLGTLRLWVWQQYLEDWERVYGLPNTCSKGDQLLQERTFCLPLPSLSMRRHQPRMAQTLCRFSRVRHYYR